VEGWKVGESGDVWKVEKALTLLLHLPAFAMKFLLLLLLIYLAYKYWFRQPKPLNPPQEPDLFIPHEEVKKEDEKNK